MPGGNGVSGPWLWLPFLSSPGILVTLDLHENILMAALVYSLSLLRGLGMSLSLEITEAKSPANMVFCIEGMGHCLSLGRKNNPKEFQIRGQHRKE